jgi:hypothetical protein
MTARHLVKCSSSLSEDAQNPQLNTRRNTAKVVLGLTVVFAVSYVSSHILEIYAWSTIKYEIIFGIDID